MASVGLLAGIQDEENDLFALDLLLGGIAARPELLTWRIEQRLGCQGIYLGHPFIDGPRFGLSVPTDSVR